MGNVHIYYLNMKLIWIEIHDLKIHNVVNNLYLAIIVEDTFFEVFKLFNSDHFYIFSCRRNAQVTFVEKPQLKK